MPAPAEITTQYGKYFIEVMVQEGAIQYVRYFSMNKGTYPVTMYEDFVNFFERIIVADGAKVVLAKQ